MGLYLIKNQFPAAPPLLLGICRNPLLSSLQPGGTGARKVAKGVWTLGTLPRTRVTPDPGLEGSVL